ncbi:MAG: L-glutamate gamma-semialdehyde dehydrogenase [Actinomycetota bacterium]|nr:MAG: L-glutamate gamma-semialdehyde dehydrogenase [Actinomycetota bacterium]
MDALTAVPEPVNERVLGYAPGSPERADVLAALAELAGGVGDLPMTIGGRRCAASGDPVDVVAPHAHRQVLGTLREAGHVDARAAVRAALAAAPGWRDLSFDDRAAVLLRAADLLSGPWRARLNAATMLGQGKTVGQAEIDAACELADFWRFNAWFGSELLAEQPRSAPGVWNRADHRPLEGFVYAVSPFNFTAIAGNLPTAPALMGNTVIWKPAPTQQLAAQLTLQLLEEAGLPDGVINLVTGSGVAVSEVVLADPDLAGIHFTGSTAVFQQLWRAVGANIAGYRGYPRLVGETGGKDFVLAHPSADLAVLRTALVRGAFEYQGQKCSAASRAYLPRSVWERLGAELVDLVDELPIGPVTDLSVFAGALIDRRAFNRVTAAIDRAASDPTVRIIAGGTYDDSDGWFVRPTLLLCSDPTREWFSQEIFGPVLALHVFDDADYDTVVRQLESVAPYALTGSIIAQDRDAISAATQALRFAAGNLYINDKPTGAVVGQQPFGGARASGTNDKSGSRQNLLRWTSTRVIKETFVPPVDHRYPHQL